MTRKGSQVRVLYGPPRTSVTMAIRTGFFSGEKDRVPRDAFRIKDPG
jgi:hypothetical protein